jgi:hypothetical protein
MAYTSLRKWLIGFGFPGGTRAFSFQGQVPAGKTLSRPAGPLWPSGLISRPVGISAGSRSGTCVFMEVVMPVGAARGTDSGCGRGSGWARLDVNREDPVEMALAAGLQRSALAHVAESSCKTYTSRFNLFVA